MDETQQSGPEVSILIVSYNCEAALRRCLQSVAGRTNPEKSEVLVVDCGSSDGCPAIDHEFPSTTILRLPRHFGATKATNIGMRTAKGEFVLFLDPAVDLPANALPALVKRLREREDAAAVCLKLTGPSGEELSIERPPPGAASFREALRTGEAARSLAGPESVEKGLRYPVLWCALTRMSILRGINYLDERYGHFGWDWDLEHQIRRGSKKILYVTDPAAAWHPDSAAEILSTPAARGVLLADQSIGSALFVGKYDGALAGMAFQFRALMGALGAWLTFQQPAVAWHRFSHLLGGQKIDGAQAVI